MSEKSIKSKMVPGFWLLALGYAVVVIATTSLCLVGSCWGNLSILTISASLGSLVLPSLYGMIVLPEENALTAGKGIGFVLAFLCLGLNFISVKEEKEKQTADFRFRVVCLIVFCTQGSALILFNLVNRFYGEYADYRFLWTQLICSVVLLAVLLVGVIKVGRQTRGGSGKRMSGSNIILILLYALLFLTSDALSLKCAGMVPLVFQGPISFCVPIIVIALIDRFIFGVKLDRIKKIQMIMAFISCVCIIAF